MNDDDTLVFKSIGVVIIVAVVLLFFSFAMYGTFLNMQTKAIQHSYEYVQTNQELLAKYILEYGKLENEKVTDAPNAEMYANQQQALLSDMCQTLNKLPEENRTDTIRHFFAQHNCGG